MSFHTESADHKSTRSVFSKRYINVIKSFEVQRLGIKTIALRFDGSLASTNPIDAVEKGCCFVMDVWIQNNPQKIFRLSDMLTFSLKNPSNVGSIFLSLCGCPKWDIMKYNSRRPFYKYYNMIEIWLYGPLLWHRMSQSIAFNINMFKLSTGYMPVCL